MTREAGITDTGYSIRIPSSQPDIVDQSRIAEEHRQ